jgi:hypothetical protein
VINIRYHIISLVAVFLALGLGLALGSSFIDTVVVRTLENNLETLGNQKDALQRENGQQQEQLQGYEDLGEQAAAALLGGHLDSVPTYIVAVRGVDEAPVVRSGEALAAAGSPFGGTLWLTERLSLDDESERQDLAVAMGLDPTTAEDPDALREGFVLRFGNLLADALRPTDPLGLPQATTTTEGDGEEPSEPGTTIEVDDPQPEPPLITALRSAGFVEFEPPVGGDADAGLRLPFAGARLLMVSGGDADVADDQIVDPLLRRLAVAGPTPVVAAQSIDADPPDGEAPSRTSFVGAIRDDEELRVRLSTVDDLELFAGRVALVLALEQSADGRFGHYGLGDGADQVVPVAPEAE